MDIPDTGAIFTLGKSHLAENAQSYFFIKNDPVKRLTSGSNQSAVICESGRLFVWGENQFGQLGIGGSGGGSGGGGNGGTNNTQIVTKPTCVKSLKALGLKAYDIAFGNGWCTTLTHSSEIFFAGRNIFTEDTASFQHFSLADLMDVGESFYISRKPFRLEEFDGLLEDNKQEDFQKISAGNDHLVVLTSHGRVFGWGGNDNNQLGLLEKILPVPVEITMNGKIKDIICGPLSTLLLTENNQLFLAGSLNDFHYPTFTELTLTGILVEQITSLYISKGNEIFFVTNSGGIYKSNESNRNKKVIFQKFYDYDNEENGPAVKLVKGNLFFAALTKKNKLFTTFSESGHHLKTFREISKLKNLKILDLAVGDRHILVFGIPKSQKSSSGQSKLMNRTYTTSAVPLLLNGAMKEIENDESPQIAREKNISQIDHINSEDSNGNLNEVGEKTKPPHGEENINGNSFVNENNSMTPENNETIKQQTQAPEMGNNTSIKTNNDDDDDDDISALQSIQRNYVAALKDEHSDAVQNEIVKIAATANMKNKHREKPTGEESPETMWSIHSEEVNNNAMYIPDKETDARKLQEDAANVATIEIMKSQDEINVEAFSDEERQKNKILAENENFINESNEIGREDYSESAKNSPNTSREFIRADPQETEETILENGMVTEEDQQIKMLVEIASSNESLKELSENIHQLFNSTSENDKNITDTENVFREISSGINIPSKRSESVDSVKMHKTSDNTNVKTEQSPKIVRNETLVSPKKPESKIQLGYEVTTINNSFLHTPEMSESPMKSPRGSERSIKFDEKSLKSQKSQERLVRPHTPYPDGKQETPSTVKKAHNSGRNGEIIVEKPHSGYRDNLENIPEKPPSVSQIQNFKYSGRDITRGKLEKGEYLDLDDNDEYSKEDEKLIVEINSTGHDSLDKTMINEIRFINNGVDVTEHLINDSIANKSALHFEEKLLGNDPGTEIPKTATQFYKDITKSELAKSSISPDSRKAEELKTKTNEDDERTTASVNSNLSGNLSESISDISDKPKDNITRNIQDIENQGPVATGPGKRTVQKFITDIKNKGKEMSCRNNRSTQVEDEPPMYSPVDERYDSKTSKVCTIL